MKTFHSFFLNCTLYLLLCTFLSHSQGTWTQKASVFTSPRAGVLGFSIGNKGYMGTGWDYVNYIYYDDFWEWDQGTSAWTQKASFAGAARGDAVAFSIGNKGYVVTGQTSSGAATNELWEWNQATNTWSQKAMFPGVERVYAAAFSIGLKGYIGFGYGSFPLNDFWEYDQLTDSWLQKTSMPVERLVSVSMSIGSKGYISTGQINGGYLDDLWEYNPASNSWSQKANFPGGLRGFAAGFSIDNKGYMGTGWDDVNAFSDFWQFDPALNIWTQMANYPHTVTDIDRAGFSVGCKGYFGSGATNPTTPTTYYNDFWEYEPDTCSLTSIADNGNNPLTLTVSPNPFSEKLNISINNNQPSIIILYDVGSKEVIHKNFISSALLNTKSLAKGIYIYEVRNGSEFIKRDKILKF